MSYPPAALTKMYRRNSERRMRMRAYLQRKTEGPPPGAGYRGEQINDGPAEEIKCFFPVTLNSERSLQTTVPIDFIMHSHGMIVPSGTRISEGDVVEKILDPELRETMIDHPLKITGVKPRPAHIYVLLEEIR